MPAPFSRGARDLTTGMRQKGLTPSSHPPCLASGPGSRVVGDALLAGVACTALQAGAGEIDQQWCRSWRRCGACGVEGDVWCPAVCLAPRVGKLIERVRLPHSANEFAVDGRVGPFKGSETPHVQARTHPPSRTWRLAPGLDRHLGLGIRIHCACSIQQRVGRPPASASKASPIAYGGAASAKAT